MSASTENVEDSLLAVEFEVTRADLEASVGRQLERTMGSRRSSSQRTFILCLLGAIVIGLIVFRNFKLSMPHIVLLGGYVVTAGGLLVTLLRSRNVVQKAVAHVIDGCSDAAVLGPERIEISPLGVTCQHGYMILTHLWGGVESIDCCEDGISFKTGAMTSYFIPRRAFKMDSEMRAFVTQAEEWRSRA